MGFSGAVQMENKRIINNDKLFLHFIHPSMTMDVASGVVEKDGKWRKMGKERRVRRLLVR